MEAEKVDDIIQRKRQREAVKKEQEAVRKLIMEEEERIARKEQEEKLQEERLASWKEHERKFMLKEQILQAADPVSYTHLTLPTSDLV